MKKTGRAWQKQIEKILLKAREASREAAAFETKLKNRLLKEAAAEIEKRESRILAANRRDLAQAEKDGLTAAMIDRLRLNRERIRQMADGVRMVASLEDPVGKVLSRWSRPNGLKISKICVPLGVILIIYESRPNVTVECASLCLKSGNAVLLRGGKEAFHSNTVLASIFSAVLKRSGVPAECVSFIPTTERSAVDFLLHRESEINLVIPRGGQSLIRKVVENSRIPVIKHYQGVCHVYIDDRADLRKGINIAFNAKMQRTGVCNAMETLLVSEKIAPRFLPALGEKLKEGGCEVRGDRRTCSLLPWARPAKPDDYGREFLDKILAVRIVRDVNEAVDHIQKHGSGHTDAIVTENRKAAQAFISGVDSSSVMVNASTRFADGFEYGFGAEIGISTDKIHARGPMGLEGLTTYKYVVEGHGQVRG